MRVLLACDWHLKYTISHALALHDAGASVSLLCRTHANEFGGSVEEHRSFLREIGCRGIDVLLLPGRISAPTAVPRLVSLVRKIRRWRPDVVHAQDNHDPRLFALTRGYPTVFTIHDPVPHLGAPPVGALATAVRRLWLQTADSVIVHGEELRDGLAGAIPPNRVAVIPHGTSMSPEPFAPPSTPTILFFGRLEAYKGARVLLAAMEIVWGERPDVHLLVAGQGPEARHFASLDRVELMTGYVPEEKVDTLLECASLVVLPYVEGSQSGIGLRAIGRGIPTIVTSVGALAALAPDPSFVVPPNDAAPLAEALLAHVDDGVEARAAVHRHASEEFSWGVTARKSLDVYSQVLRRGA